MINGYGNSPISRKRTARDDVDQPHPRRSVAEKIAQDLHPVARDTRHHRELARLNGWTDEQYDDWVIGCGTEGLRDG